MKGHNTLTINHATMVEAVQLWINQQFAEKKPKVIKVRRTDKNFEYFEVDIEGDSVDSSQGEMVKANIARPDGT